MLSKWAVWLRWLNVFDVVSTLTGVCLLHAHEANPVMRWMIELSPWFFGIFKIVSVEYVIRLTLKYKVTITLKLLVWVYAVTALNNAVMLILGMRR